MTTTFTPAQVLFCEADLISVYTRQQAITDGVLVDVSDTAKEAGFTWPVAITAEVWATINDIPASKSYQDVQGRLWDVIYMASHAARHSTGKRQLLYKFIMHHKRKTYVTLKLDVGPGDDAEPVITIMHPWQD